MNPITITINPPITEHCRDCDYEAARSFCSHRAECPECKSRNMMFGARPHKEKAIFITATNLGEKQWNYTFHNVNGEQSRYSFVVNDELDYSDPCCLAKELKEIIDGNLISSYKPKIAELVDLICNDNEEERQENLRTRDKKEKLERELYKLIYLRGLYEHNS